MRECVLVRACTCVSVHARESVRCVKERACV